MVATKGVGVPIKCCPSRLHYGMIIQIYIVVCGKKRILTFNKLKWLEELGNSMEIENFEGTCSLLKKLKEQKEIVSLYCMDSGSQEVSDTVVSCGHGYFWKNEESI